MTSPAEAVTDRMPATPHDDLPTPHHTPTTDYEPTPVISEKSPISLSLALGLAGTLIAGVGFAATLRVQLEYLELKVKENQATSTATQADVVQIKTDVALIRQALDQRNLAREVPQAKSVRP
jgi:hypothetical protein